MLIEFLILFEIIAVLLLGLCFVKGGVVNWALAIILFSFVAFSFFNVERPENVVDDETISGNITSYDYVQIPNSSKDLSLVFLNVGLSGFCLVFFFIEIFK